MVQLQHSKISRTKYVYLSDYVFTLDNDFFVCIECTLMLMILYKCHSTFPVIMHLAINAIDCQQVVLIVITWC